MKIIHQLKKLNSYNFKIPFGKTSIEICPPIEKLNSYKIPFGKTSNEICPPIEKVRFMSAKRDFNSVTNLFRMPNS